MKILPGQRGIGMNSKLTADHLGRGAVVDVRQSTMGQVTENTESQRRQYGLAEAARAIGFASVSVIDDDLGAPARGWSSGRASSKLVASVCTGRLAPSLHRGLPPRAQRPRLASSDRPVRARSGRW